MECRCNRCTYNDPIRMRLIDGFWTATCPRCGTEFTKVQPKHPCQGCIYFKVCGENTRTVPCEGRVTKSEKKKDSSL